jgi:hypothetical protein
LYLYPFLATADKQKDRPRKILCEQRMKFSVFSKNANVNKKYEYDFSQVQTILKNILFPIAVNYWTGTGSYLIIFAEFLGHTQTWSSSTSSSLCRLLTRSLNRYRYLYSFILVVFFNIADPFRVLQHHKFWCIANKL